MERGDPFALEAKAVEALVKGDVEAGFRWADRRCRIAVPPGAGSFVLRAEALNRMGRSDLALADLARALAIAPEDGPANRRMMAWAQGDLRTEAALALLEADHAPAVHRQAFGLVRADRGRPVGRITLDRQTIAGWAVWDDPALPVEVTVSGEDGKATWIVPPDAACSPGAAQATRFRFKRPPSRGPQHVALTAGRCTLHAIDAAPTRPPNQRPRPSSRAAGDGVAVVLPVYGDADATRACLASLLAAIGSSPAHRVIIVDDASPDPAVKAVLAEVAGDPRVDILVNPYNLGFVGSVNRALAACAACDVVLLNADTLVPRGFLEGLASAARSSPSIGTLTPLSNNGEFTSFPVANRSNELPSLREVQRLHDLASRVNAGRLVELPSGIGFCLYITRACLDATGLLSDDYHRGYLEDVDFCLRARALGFRNLCATAVFVGHAGSRSFGRDKRALVVRNLRTLEDRFPTHRSECAAFIAADPLRPARDRLERAFPLRMKDVHLLVATAGVLADVARQRARQLGHAARRAVILEAGATGVRVYDPSGVGPQSLRFDLTRGQECTNLADYLAALDIARIELLDLLDTPPALLEAVLATGRPLDVVFADGALLPFLDGSGSSIGSAVPHPADARRRALDRAERILVPSDDAEAMLGRCPSHRPILRIGPRRNAAVPATGGGRHLGIVPVTSSAREEGWIAAIASRLAGERPDIKVIVLGAVRDEGAFRDHGSIVVTGPIATSEFLACTDAYGIGRLFLALDRPVFGHPATALARRSRPTAFIDWSLGTFRGLSGDLAIDPRWPAAVMIDRLAAWLP